jgi:hypothetical protein
MVGKIISADPWPSPYPTAISSTRLRQIHDAATALRHHRPHARDDPALTPFGSDTPPLTKTQGQGWSPNATRFEARVVAALEGI